MGSKIGFEMSLIVVEAIRGRCASFMILTATVSEIFGGQTNSSILAVKKDTSSRGNISLHDVSPLVSHAAPLRNDAAP